MIDSKQIAERLSTVLTDAFHVDPVAVDLDLIDASILDSPQLLELLSRLEREFGLDLSLADVDLDSVRTFERIVRFVARRATVKRAPPRPAVASS